MSYQSSLRSEIVRKEVIGDNVFLNINLSNPERNTRQVEANLSTTLISAVVEDPTKYNLIISRFSIPGRTIPLFFFQTNNFPNTDINQGIYSIVISYGGLSTAPTYLSFIPQTFVPANISFFSAQEPAQDPLDPYYYNFSYQNLANMINNALLAAISAGSGFLPLDVHAYMIYNNQSGFFSLLGTQNMANSNNPSDPANVQIWFNTPLANLFTGFKTIHGGYNTVSGRDSMILIENDLNNSPASQDGFNPSIPDGYYQMQLEFNSDSSLETLTRIFITSNSLGGVVSQSEVVDSNGGSYQNIVADFIPTASTTNGSYRSKLQYFAQSEFYRRTLTQKTPLTEINIRFLWQGIRPSINRPLLIQPGDTLSIQFILEKR